MTNSRLVSLHIQQWIVVTAIVLFALKGVAYFLTRSVSILTDALESIVNIVAGAIGLYSLYLSSQPKDENHPYGHGKIEFISAAIEGTLITIAGLLIIYKSVYHLIFPKPLQQLDYGIVLVAASAVINFVVGHVATRAGEKNHSLALVASGRHLKSDTYSSVAIILGLALIYFTGIYQLDNLIAAVFGVIIIITGYRILRSSIAGIMDEADEVLLKKLIATLNENRRENWIDLHKLRVIKFGSILHVDCHMTVPWYLTVNEAHREIEHLTALIRDHFGEAMEFFVHTDGCLYSQCALCARQQCHVRRHAFESRITWSLDNTIRDKKHEWKPESVEGGLQTPA